MNKKMDEQEDEPERMLQNEMAALIVILKQDQSPADSLCQSPRSERSEIIY